MKKCLGLLVVLMLVSVRASAIGFLDSVPRSERVPAGLEKLTPEELARLEELVERYKSGELVQLQQQADAKVAAAKQEAEARIAAAATAEANRAQEELARVQQQAEAKIAAARSEAEKKIAAARAQEEKSAGPGGGKVPHWYNALLTLNRAGERPEKEQPLESQLEGDFSGWRGRTVFKLQNGTQWIQQNQSENYICSPVKHSPKVRIKPAALGGFWLEIEGVNPSVRVVPLKLN